jgi:7,8-dihydro-6-hydroxymethylpterin dimethyltransferase
MADPFQSPSTRFTPTESLCPSCLRKIPALPVLEGTDVYLTKTCPEHGSFKTVVWRGDPECAAWFSPKPRNSPLLTQTSAERGCPLDCGLCPEHEQQTCCVLLEVTSRCDLGCPVCFAASGGPAPPDPSLDEIQVWFRSLTESAGACNIQLSGGEPTMRDDLPQLIALGRRLGFSFFQLNTNGLRLATQPEYARALREAGLSTVFMQFDGLDDDLYRKIRGKPLFEQKEAAIANCSKAGLGIVLVPTLVPGVNVDSIGAIIDYALQHLPHVRGVHFQPVSYLGRYPRAPLDDDRYTLPELRRDIETQTDGRIAASTFHTSGCEHALCSFSGDYVLLADGSVLSLADPDGAQACCCDGDRTRAAQRQRDFVARRWSPDPTPGGGPAPAAGVCLPGETPLPAGPAAAVKQSGSAPSLDEFLERLRNYGFTITAMAFQDVWTLDLERLRNCHLHVVAGKGRLVPFCAYNLTDAAGHPLYRPAL